MYLQVLHPIIIIQVQDLESSEEFIRKFAVWPQQNLNQVLMPIHPLVVSVQIRPNRTYCIAAERVGVDTCPRAVHTDFTTV